LPLPRHADSCTACKPQLSCDAQGPATPHLLLRPAPQLASKSRCHDSSSNGHNKCADWCTSPQPSPWTPASLIHTRPHQRNPAGLLVHLQIQYNPTGLLEIIIDLPIGFPINNIISLWSPCVFAGMHLQSYWAPCAFTGMPSHPKPQCHRCFLPQGF